MACYGLGQTWIRRIHHVRTDDFPIETSIEFGISWRNWCIVHVMVIQTRIAMGLGTCSDLAASFYIRVWAVHVARK